MDNEISVLLFIEGRRIELHCSRVKGVESGAEFSGRYLCEIEDRIRKELRLKPMAPIPAGIRWMQWRNDGHTFGRFTILGSPEVRETTGEPYQNRTRKIPIPSTVARPWEVETIEDAARIMAELTEGKS